MKKGHQIYESLTRPSQSPNKGETRPMTHWDEIEAREIGAEVQNWDPSKETNVWEHSGLYEGDILLELGRNGLLNKTARWPKGIIPYRIEEEDFTEGEVLTIRKAIKEYHNKTCLKFRPLRKSDENWVEIVGSRSGCWSSVGMQGDGQLLNLQTPNCVRFGVVLHELMHAVGFYHQQSASNRDDFVKIHWENIKDGREHNFNKYNTSVITDFGVQYDYKSVMHYSGKAFSKNQKPTIEALKANTTLGQRDGFTESDVRKLNVMYEEECKKRVAEPEESGIDWGTLLAPWKNKDVQD
ncbi:zinc metalloproteinase nas-13-like [Culicoides brevitarsis]|uniref:zinc metalloproteinase nas-13-like n=1 Tax=Culicoides brevitarsis TaxID=469753 RepID=UPI00307B287F